MFKYLFKVIVIFLFLTLNSKSEIVKNIEITGNKRISKETILVLANIKIDQEFTDISLNNALCESSFSIIGLSVVSGRPPLLLIITAEPLLEASRLVLPKGSSHLEQTTETLIVLSKFKT